ncbi:MAG: hypothetical protein QM820_43850 [Minicystis sp.]
MIRRSPLLRRVAALLAAAALLPSLPSPTAAAPALGSKLDPGIERAIRTGLVGPWHRHRPQPGLAPVVIELIAPATPKTLGLLRAAGAELDTAEGEIVY